MQHGDTPRRILVLSGPNLASLGTRQPEIYGSGTLDELISGLTAFGAGVGVEITHRQTDDEAELISLVASADADGIVINPGALTHTSRALSDALRGSALPAVEVHISDIHTRDHWRSVSMVSDACVLTITGRGRSGYHDGVRHLVNRWAVPFETLRYGPHRLNVGELRSADPGGIVVLVHGGVWRRPYGRDAMESLAVDLHRRGVSTWNVGYRRVGEGGGWPGSAHDVLTALDHAARSGPVSVVGHSAGGYLALWASARAAVAPRRLVAMAPIVDLELASTDQEIGKDAQSLLENGAPQRAAPGRVPTLVIHGRADTVVSMDHSAGIAAENAEVRIIDAGHFDLLDPSKPHWPQVVDFLAADTT